MISLHASSLGHVQLSCLNKKFEQICQPDEKKSSFGENTNMIKMKRSEGNRKISEEKNEIAFGNIKSNGSASGRLKQRLIGLAFFGYSRL